jgi:uncharacterized protein (TIGR00369 family)
MNFIDFVNKLKGTNAPLVDPYGEWLGYQILDYDLDKKTVRTTIEIRNKHLSPSKAVHGGVVSGFLDFSLGCAVFTTLEQTQLASTVDLAVKYFKPLLEGDEVIATARVLHRGRTLCSVVAELAKKGDPDTLVAMATGTFNIYQFKFKKIGRYKIYTC